MTSLNKDILCNIDYDVLIFIKIITLRLEYNTNWISITKLLH
jgi:hypothetical protein